MIPIEILISIVKQDIEPSHTCEKGRKERVNKQSENLPELENDLGTGIVLANQPRNTKCSRTGILSANQPRKAKYFRKTISLTNQPKNTKYSETNF